MPCKNPDSKSTKPQEAHGLDRAAKAAYRDATGIYRANGSITARTQDALLTILSFQNERTGQCNPSYEAIRVKTGLAKQTITDAIAQGEAIGLIRRTNERRVGVRQGRTVPMKTANSYTFPHNTAGKIWGAAVAARNERARNIAERRTAVHRAKIERLRTAWKKPAQAPITEQSAFTFEPSATQQIDITAGGIKLSPQALAAIGIRK